MNIAVTGGMGSGKSKVSKVLAELLGAKLVSVDHICRNLLQPGSVCLGALRQVVPESCFLADGSLNRPALREILFADDCIRQHVNSVVHPQVREEVLRLCRDSLKSPIPLVVEIPLLFETGWQGDFDCTLLVYANDIICAKRVMRRDLVEEEAALLGIAAQMPIEEKILLADFFVDNSSTFAETVGQLEDLVETETFLGKRNGQ